MLIQFCRFDIFIVVIVCVVRLSTVWLRHATRKITVRPTESVLTWACVGATWAGHRPTAPSRHVRSSTGVPAMVSALLMTCVCASPVGRTTAARLRTVPPRTTAPITATVYSREHVPVIRVTTARTVAPTPSVRLSTTAMTTDCA